LEIAGINEHCPRLGTRAWFPAATRGVEAGSHSQVSTQECKFEAMKVEARY